MLFAEIGEGWIVGIAALATSVISACVAAYATIKKQKSELKKQEAEESRAEIVYLFQEYKNRLDEVKAQLTSDRVIMGELQKDHTHCIEERAANKERIASQDIRIADQNNRLAEQDQRIAVQDARIKHLESLLDGKRDGTSSNSATS